MLKNRQIQSNIQQRKRSLSSTALAHVISKPLSPFHAFLGFNVTHDPSKKYGETYNRSQFSYYADTRPEKFYKKKMQNGDRAHLGAYANNFERLGDHYKEARTGRVKFILRAETTSGNAELYNRILQYKNQICASLVSQLNDLHHMTVGFYNDYPCVMVHIKRNSIHQGTGTRPSDAAFEAWVNFLASTLVGIVNFHAVQAGLPIELIRRSSFGFLSPTIADTHQSFRINMGIVPKEYVKVLEKSLKSLDRLLVDLQNKHIAKKKLPAGLFYGSSKHKTYLTANKKQKYATPLLQDCFQLLWQQVEKNGKTTVQNLMRTAFCRDGIAAEVYRSLQNNHEDLLASATSGLVWATRQLKIIAKPKSLALSFVKTGSISYPSVANLSSISKDKTFWKMIASITASFKKHYSDDIDMMKLVRLINQQGRKNDLNDLYARLEALNEHMLAYEISHPSEEPFPEDGYGSDSDCEDEKDNETIYSRKIIVSNGMRAILSTLLAIGYKLTDFSLYCDAVYYEVTFGQKLLGQFANMHISMRNPTTMTTATAYLLDVNACVTNGKDLSKAFDHFLDQTEKKILVLDTTSASTDQANAYIEKFRKSRASALFFVSSGLKNEQLGADRNSYGTVRLFTKNKALRNQYYNQIKKQEPNVDSPMSHQYRRAMKKMGAVPTSGALFKKA